MGIVISLVDYDQVKNIFAFEYHLNGVSSLTLHNVQSELKRLLKGYKSEATIFLDSTNKMYIAVKPEILKSFLDDVHVQSILTKYDVKFKAHALTTKSAKSDPIHETKS